MSDIAGFPFGAKSVETPVPAPETFTELDAEQLGLSQPYAPLGETPADDAAPAEPDPPDPPDADEPDEGPHSAAGADRVGQPVPATSVPLPRRPDDPPSVPVTPPQIAPTDPPGHLPRDLDGPDPA